jgi:hypothetical protein
MKTSSFFTAAFLALSVGCFNQDAGDVKVTIDNKIQGENGKEIKFAVFGAAENNGQVSMVVIASDNEDLCGEIGNDAAGFIDGIQSGEEAGEFVLTTVLVDGQLAAGEKFDGDKQNGQVVDPQFIVGNGAKLVVQAVDKDAEGSIEITDFNGATLVGNIEANLNKELSGIFNDDLNEPITTEIFLATECGALTDFAQAQF